MTAIPLCMWQKASERKVRIITDLGIPFVARLSPKHRTPPSRYSSQVLGWLGLCYIVVVAEPAEIRG